ncbi:hypothetical protein [Allorhodopirellula heiligendammensis]|uniref:Uncharacterized protein n=1 Tax=Allorhodopirellula heiligendammensis TaxID=2714739 RepID=A0A5C6C3V5_9BACT|nr:hypothetical protein [Allorhodopirellula heiligendammensis]TWU18838.1 hypothetical protein Poly21_10040 [Allorhodopirellula heiligendammensis]
MKLNFPLRGPSPLVASLFFSLLVTLQCHGQPQDVPSPTLEIPILDTVVESWPVDAMMTRAQERAIWEALCQPYAPTAIKIPLDDWVASVRSICPMEIDTIALEGIGLTTDHPISFRVDTPPQTLLVHLSSALEDLDCVVEVRHGVVRITTKDTADNRLPVRIYDVSSLTGDGDVREKLIATKFLSHTIQTVIEPDDWEVLGGVSVIQLFPMKDKQLLCVATRTQTHWRLQAFLDQLQRAGGESPVQQSTLPQLSTTPPLKFQPKVEPRKSTSKPGAELPRFRPQ